VFQSNVNTAANIDVASINLRNLTANSNAVTLSPPSSLGSNYTLILPTLPTVQSFVTLDAAGNFAAPYQLDNMTLNLNGSLIEVAPQGVTAAQIANNTITAAQIANGTITGTQIGTNAIFPSNLPSPNYVVTGSSGSFTTSSTSDVLVAAQSVNITTNGRPVAICIKGDGSTSPAQFGTISNYSGGITGTIVAACVLSIKRNGTVVSEYAQNTQQSIFNPPSSGTVVGFVPPPSFILDPGLSAGSYTYTVSLRLVQGTTAVCDNITMVVEEL
jgi:hypothetical protein